LAVAKEILFMNKILVTGGCGFIGSNLVIHLSEMFPAAEIHVLDNLSRIGSFLNVARLKEHGIEVHLGDIRNASDLERLEVVDVIIDAAAEPSVMAGIANDPKTLIDINLGGTLQCLELARKWRSTFIYLSTSRVYSYKSLNNLHFEEHDTRFDFSADGPYFKTGIDETFDTLDLKSFYGTSKFASEQFIREYAEHYQIPYVINRFGVIAGPWQMGKVDQGFLALWVASHYFKRPLQYVGFGGLGKQVRDILHIDDLCRVIALQLESPRLSHGKIWNVGGGFNRTISLLELTKITEEITGNKIFIRANGQTRPVDVRIFYTNNSMIKSNLKWEPEKTVRECVKDTYLWICAHEKELTKIFNA
jgi:CDP-paratose 2-epimerase